MRGEAAAGLLAGEHFYLSGRSEQTSAPSPALGWRGHRCITSSVIINHILPAYLAMYLYTEPYRVATTLQLAHQRGFMLVIFSVA